MNTRSVQSLSNEELLHDLERTAANERNATVDLIVLLAEMDARRLYLQQGYSSLFVYCTRHLHLSEHAAYGRIEAARGASFRLSSIGWLTDRHADSDPPAVELPINGESSPTAQ